MTRDFGGRMQMDFLLLAEDCKSCVDIAVGC
jgi:hypothetical protein